MAKTKQNLQVHVQAKHENVVYMFTNVFIVITRQQPRDISINTFSKNIQIQRVMFSVATFATTWQNPSKTFKFI